MTACGNRFSAICLGHGSRDPVSLAMGAGSLSELTGKQIFGRLTIDI
jgi:hypothetical protein